VKTLGTVEELRQHVGELLGVSAWHDVDQARIDAFAAATGDFYWVHVDPERAAAGPHGTTIAHGLYTLSLGPMFTDSLVDFDFRVRLNYGYDRVRFPAPVPVGSRLRMRLELAELAPRGEGVALTLLDTFEREGAEKPVCVAQQLIYLAP
jgi:acyl dehydratase